MRLVIAVLTFLSLLPAPAFAQTPPPTVKAAWHQSEDLATAQTYTATMQVDTGAPVALTPVCVASTAPITGSECSGTFPLLSAAAPHTYLLSVCSSVGCRSASVSGALPGLSNFRITITSTTTTTVQLGEAGAPAAPVITLVKEE